MAEDPHWETIGPPPLGLFALEQARAAREFAGFLAARRRVRRRARRGDGHAVLVLPGFLAGDFSTAPLRSFLRGLCYDARAWKLGINRGPTPAVREGLDRRLQQLFERHGGRKVSLVGWSLGGLYARELARFRPERVRRVVTLATPFRDISANHAARFVQVPPGGLPLREARGLHQWLRQPLPVPSTSIYSRSDGIVHWQSCLEDEGPGRENVEVDSSHTGMGFHPRVFEILADRLALPEGEWRPYAERDAGASAAGGAAGS